MSGRIRILILLAAALEAALVGLERTHVEAWYFAAASFYLIGIWWVRRAQPTTQSGRELRWILLAAVLFRLTLLPWAPVQSRSLYRTHWDGKIQHLGFNPYEYPPQSGLFNPVRVANDGLTPHPDQAGYRLPGAEMLAHWSYALTFRVRGEKLLLVFWDVLLMLALVRVLRQMKLPPDNVLIYAWSPLAVVEVAGNGHLEPVAVLLALLALYWAGRRPRLAALAVILAATTQWFALALAPTVLAKGLKQWKSVAGVVVACLVAVLFPYVFINKHLALRVLAADIRRHWAGMAPFNASVFSLINTWFGRRAAEAGAAAVVLGTVAAALVRRTPALRAGFVIVSAMLLVLPQVQPWYLLWLLPLVAVWPEWPWIYLAVAVAVAYLLPAHPWLLWVEYAPVYALLAWQAAQPLTQARRREWRPTSS